MLATIWRVSPLGCATNKRSGRYAWLRDIWPKEWTHRYRAVFRPDSGLNFGLVISDGKDLHPAPLYHLDSAVADKASVIVAYTHTVSFCADTAKPPWTTWQGTPLHELWLPTRTGN